MICIVCAVQAIVLRSASPSQTANAAGRTPFPKEGRLFIDSAVVADWEEVPHGSASYHLIISEHLHLPSSCSQLLPLGIFHGITTNPTLLERASHACSTRQCAELAEKAFALGAKEFMLQTWGPTVKAMVDVGLELSKPDRERIVVKVPVTLNGTVVAAKLISSGVRVCLTTSYSREQALVASGVGAECEPRARS